MSQKNTDSANATKSEVASREEAILHFWREYDIFNKSLNQEAPNGDYIFYDGPPFATGLPHYGHILASTIKDAIPRFWTMNGYRVRRTWGWDCHGLPLENLIEKELGLATKRDIEEYGIKNFNEKARAAVLRYADDWKEIIPRMGRWADMEHDYKTMDSTYTESVWWVFKTLHEKGLVYEGFKSMHLCPRCGTTLSNFEVNQGYKDVKDIAVTVKLPLLDESGHVTNTSLLVWTTTPWTLPGNLAAAVHNEHTYVKVNVTTKDGEALVILAKERLAQLGTDEYSIIEEMPGSALVGRSYQPPFQYLIDQDMPDKENAWKIYHADYVELGEEGTGAVHLAPAYGEEDMELAQQHGIPIFHHVDESGRFKDFVTDFAGQLVKPKDDVDAEVSHLDADIMIVKALAANGKLFKKENITHSYPHCWRCDTPLLNYATTSWFVAVTDIKDALVAENNKITWVPAHVGSNRFGKWLEGARDWAVSRQRYWGAPLPVWRNPETNTIKVFGSLAELQEYVEPTKNEYVAMRHGEAVSNLTRRISTDTNTDDPLTETGRAQAVAAAASLRDSGIDLIITSPFQRTKETAEIIRSELGLPSEAVIEEPLVGETRVPTEYDGQPWSALADFFATPELQYQNPNYAGESTVDLKKRAGTVFKTLEQQYVDKKILIVTHKGMLRALKSVAAAHDYKQSLAFQRTAIANAELHQLPYRAFPHNDNYELDFHRPYIDTIELYEDGVKLERVPDVFDCWFESGSMPYGQHHYPFSCDEVTFMDRHFPAQFIAEGLDQTRGWFYSLLVLGTALFGQSPYQNVIVNGLVLAEDGRKMSKSLKNYPDPMDVANTLGADAMRYYLLSSPIMRGEDLNFSEKGVQEVQRKNIGRLHNVLTLYQLYADTTDAHAGSNHVLDRWILARLNALIAESTAGYRAYELDKATRPIADFIDDVSVWYVRRSRDRLKGNDETDKAAALATLRYVLRELAKLMAPAMPFYAEYLYRAVRSEDEPESVHLTQWPTGGVIDENLLADMRTVREVVTAALEARTKAGIKVRQPVASVSGPAVAVEYLPLILDELNAKTYHVADAVSIDTNITPELQAEGDAREFIRAVQEMRKQAGLAPHDRVTVTVQTSAEGQAVIAAHRDDIVRTVGANDIAFADVTEGVEIIAGKHRFMVVMSVVSRAGSTVQ